MNNIYKKGDIVVTKGYSFDFDGLALIITKAYQSGDSIYYNFERPSIYQGPWEDNYNFKENRVIEVLHSKRELSYEIY